MKKLALLILIVAYFFVFGPMPAHAATSLETWCLDVGGSWTADTCTISGDVYIDPGPIEILQAETLVIASDGTIRNNGTISNAGTIDNEGGVIGGTINNDGTINNNGRISITYGTIDNLINGTINNNDAIYNYGTIKNNGTINNGAIIKNDTLVIPFDYLTGTIDNLINGTINNDGTISNESGRIIINKGTINNNATITNNATINNYEEGTINNDEEGTINNDHGEYEKGTINNYGTITNDGDIFNNSTINNYEEGTINNKDTINNDGIINNDGTINNFCQGIYEGNPPVGNPIIDLCTPPTADFSASPTSGVPPLTVEFTNLLTGEFDECLWDFGDGGTATTCDDPSHTYSDPGTFTFTLSVNGPGGEDTMAKADYITVYGPPTADFSASPTSGVPPLTVEFTNLSTGVFDQCLWDFGDGRTSTSCDNLSRRFREEGSYIVSLTVKGPGGEDTSELTIKVAYPQLFLPVTAGNFNGPYRYFDDFSDPDSGWPSGDYEYVKLGYLNGKYQIILKTAPWSLLVTPNLALPEDYQVEGDGRLGSDNPGTFGIMFGLNWGEDSYEGYQFLIYAPAQIYLLEKRNIDGTWNTMIDWTFNDAIRSGKDSNKLRVVRTGSDIDLYVNDILVDTYNDSSFKGPGRDAGLRVYSFDGAPVDVRFDNFGAYDAP